MAATPLLTNATTNGPGDALDCTGKEAACFVITGKFEADVKFQFSIDGTNFYSFVGLLNGTGYSSETSAPGYVVFYVKPVTYIRPVIENYKSGAITVVGYAE